MAHGDITHIDIPVSDFGKATAFYSRLFGWQAPNKISGGGLAPRDEGFTQPRSYVEVDSIDDTVAAARDAGASVLMEKSEISPTSWWAVIADPDGNAIGLYEGTTEAPEA